MERERDPADSDEIDTAALRTALGSILDLLGSNGRPEPDRFFNRLEEIARNYVLDRSIQPSYGNPREQRRLIRQLQLSLKESLSLLAEVSPEYLVTLEAMAGSDRDGRDWSNSIEHLAGLTDAVGLFVERYRPKRGAPTNLPLETAISELVPLIEERTGGRVSVSLNKNRAEQPALSSPESRAIGMLLRAVHPGLSETTIVNMIEAVRDRPLGSDSHMTAIFDADLRGTIDMSLHPRRHERD